MTRREKNDFKKSLRQVVAHATGMEYRSVAVPEDGEKLFNSGNDIYADAIKVMPREHYVDRKYAPWVVMGSARKFGE